MPSETKRKPQAQQAGNQIYENISMLITAFEEAATHSGTREGFLVVANGTLEGMDSIIRGSSAVMDQLEEERDPEDGGGGGDPRRSVREFIQDVEDWEVIVPPEGTFVGVEDVNLADEFLNLFTTDEDTHRQVAEYMRECLGCNLRMEFGWQVNPMNIVSPINDIANQIGVAIDRFSLRINPLGPMESICQMLNALSGPPAVCIPDIIMIISSLRLLLRKYALGSLHIKLDWTTLLGPILQMILQGIGAMVDGLMQIIIAPINCTVATLATANDLWKASRNLYQEIVDTAQGVENTLDGLFSGQLPVNAEADTLWREVSVDDSQSIERLETVDRTGQQRTQAREAGRPQDPAFPVGVFLNAEPKNLQEALANPNWMRGATFIEKIMMPVREAEEYIKELAEDIGNTINSLNGLVGSGLVLDLDMSGALLFIADVIGFVEMLQSMIVLTIGQGPVDWCERLRERPEILEEALRTRGRMGSNVRVESDQETLSLVIKRGPDIAGHRIPTCVTGRSSDYQQAIERWIKDLETKS